MARTPEHARSDVLVEVADERSDQEAHLGERLLDAERARRVVANRTRRARCRPRRPARRPLWRGRAARRRACTAGRSDDRVEGTAARCRAAGRAGRGGRRRPRTARCRSFSRRERDDARVDVERRSGSRTVAAEPSRADDGGERRPPSGRRRRAAGSGGRPARQHRAARARAGASSRTCSGTGRARLARPALRRELRDLAPCRPELGRDDRRPGRRTRCRCRADAERRPPPRTAGAPRRQLGRPRAARRRPACAARRRSRRRAVRAARRRG